MLVYILHVCFEECNRVSRYIVRSLVGLSSLRRNTYGDRKPEPQTEANCEILVKHDFGRD